MTLQVSPGNPHYLEYAGKSTLLVGSGEHYGSVINLDFDYQTYLRTLGNFGLNHTRVFSGTYREIPGSFNIKNNTLAPAPDRYICPWAQAETSESEQVKYDLLSFDMEYFRRLKEFMRTAAQHGVIVEFVLFSFYYSQELWHASPMWVGNNTNGVGDCDPNQAFQPEATDLVPVQLCLVRKIAEELNEFDNLYYETINEPYANFDGRAYCPWQLLVAETLADMEARLPKRHLIAQNISNRTMRVTEKAPRTSILNFHYAVPSASADNYHLNVPISDDETGFAGHEEWPYRREAWQFVMAGGSIVGHLDYSFTVDHPDGTERDLGDSPGTGGANLREQLSVLRRFIEGFDLDQLQPANHVLREIQGEDEVQVGVLGTSAGQYAVHVATGPRVSMDLAVPPGEYSVEWIETRHGSVVEEASIHFSSGREHHNWVKSPSFDEDIVLRIVRIGDGHD